MSASRQRAQAHARRAHYCSCGHVVHGNGAKAAHKGKHDRAKDGHHWWTTTQWEEHGRPFLNHPDPARQRPIVAGAPKARKMSRIHLVLERPDGHRSEAEIEGAPVTSDMLDSAEDLLHTLTTGERPAIKNLYDLVARAFCTTREDAKKRITAAAYGMDKEKFDERMRLA